MIDPLKIVTIRDWPELRNVKDIQSFLGFANYYRRFIKGFQRIAKPLTRLTRKNQPFVFERNEREAFEKIKKAIISDPILCHYDPSKPCVLETDTSDFVTSGILS
jgi:hypothetical protein